MQNVSQSKCPSRGKKYCWLKRKDDLPCWQLIKTSLAFSHSGTYNQAPWSIKFSPKRVWRISSAKLNLQSPPWPFLSVAKFIANIKPYTTNSISSIVQFKSLFPHVFSYIHFFHSTLISISHFPDNALVLTVSTTHAVINYVLLCIKQFKNNVCTFFLLN